MFTPGSLISAERRVQRRRLAGSGRAGHVDDAVGLRDHLAHERQRRRVRDQLVEAEASCSTCRGCACTTFSPHLPGTVETRKSIGLPSIVTLMRPSCGSRFSEMSRRLRIFSARDQAELHLLRQPLHDLQHAVDAEADGRRPAPSARCGCRCAPCLMARPRIEFASRMIGASSDAVIRSCLRLRRRRSGVGGELQLADEVGLQQVDRGRRRRAPAAGVAASPRGAGAAPASSRLRVGRGHEPPEVVFGDDDRLDHARP